MSRFVAPSFAAEKCMAGAPLRSSGAWDLVQMCETSLSPGQYIRGVADRYRWCFYAGDVWSQFVAVWTEISLPEIPSGRSYLP